MTYSEFAANKPILYGQIIHNNKSKIGCFKPVWNKWDNSLAYSFNGKQSAPGFTLKRAYSLFNEGKLTTNPENGNPNNYI